MDFDFLAFEKVVICLKCLFCLAENGEWATENGKI